MDDARAREFRLLMECFRTGQMTAAQLRAHMEADAAFAEHVRARLAAAPRG